MRSWFKNAIIYHILIDRFAGYSEPENWNKPVFIGGNINAILKKIPYFKKLGINTIWLSPFYKTNSYHGYHVTDFFKIEPRFGTEEDLRLLIAEAHAKDIKIIADFIPNHCSNEHSFFQEALKNKKSKYRNWFIFTRWPDKYLCFLDFKNLPKLNLRNEEVKKHVIQSAIHWLSFGIDGFRIDHVVGPHYSFWKDFVKEIRTINQEAVLIGEAWMEGIPFKHFKTLGIKNKYRKWLNGLSQEKIQNEFIGILDGVLDFYFRNKIIEYIAWKEQPEKYWELLCNMMETHYEDNPTDYYLPNFIDNHDMSRFLFECSQKKERLKLALRLQFLLPQPPILYYGTESGLTHEGPVIINYAHSDLQARKPMPWNNQDRELLNYCKELIEKRKKYQKK